MSSNSHRLHTARLSVLMRALDRGWCWGVDPRRRNSPALISPRGTIFEFRGRCLVKFRNVFELEAAA